MNGNDSVIFAQQGTVYQNSMQALNALAQRYGATDYRSWQTVRRKFYFKTKYPEAGQASLVFFSNPAGVNNLTLDDTNIPQANQFGQQHFLVKAIETYLSIKTWDLKAWDGTDASTLVSDLLNGFVHAGVLQLVISNKTYAQIPCPFLYCPPGDGQERVYTRGVEALTLTEAAPNTLATLVTGAPYAEQKGFRNIYLMDPQILIEAGQTFTLTVDFPSGLVPVIGTGVTDDDANPLKVGVKLDGVLIRPKQ
jgi:hypothetical protein